MTGRREVLVHSIRQEEELAGRAIEGGIGEGGGGLPST